jgi:peptidoglycan-associated lipoprotein
MLYRTILILLFTAFLAACSTTSGSKKEGAAVEDQGTPSASSSVQTYGAGKESSYGISELDDPNSPLSKRIIYFAYDSSEIQPEYRSIIEAHAQYLAANPNVVLSLEGHTDERGSREYNLALGERRAQAVKEQMMVLGAAASQLRTISYGEERPVAEGHDEAAWSQNRRVELVY